MAGTLASRLKVPPPEVLKIITLASKDYLPLLKPTERTLSLTNRLKSYFIPSMIKTASHYGLVSLASTQINHPSKVIIVHKNPEEAKWLGYQASEKDYNVFINPKIVDDSAIDTHYDDASEFCPSLPDFEAICRRKKSILMTYENINGDEEKLVTEGFEARVIQHEVDHLIGYLMIMTPVSFGRIKGVGKVEEEVKKFQEDIEERRRVLNDLYEKNPRFRKSIERSKKTKETAINDMIMTRSMNAQILLKFANTYTTNKVEIPALIDNDYNNVLKEFKVVR